jgi:23S rRNA (uracil1939-C5)-methyltransferase
LRYVQVVVERDSERVQVVLVGNGESPAILGDLPRVFETKLGERLQGLFFNAQPERSNNIFGPTTTHLAGEASLRESLGGVEIHFPPAAFGQNHLPLFSRAVDRIAELVAPDQTVTEYYCGVGAIGLGLLGQSRAVHFNERSPDGLTGLKAGLAARPVDEQSRAKLWPGAAGDQLDALNGADVVIVDPPRKGLDPELLDSLSTVPPKQLIYLACGLPALLRELKVLDRPGGLRLRGVEAFDFFPYTGHLETLVWLTLDAE